MAADAASRQSTRRALSAGYSAGPRAAEAVSLKSSISTASVSHVAPRWRRSATPFAANQLAKPRRPPAQVKHVRLIKVLLGQAKLYTMALDTQVDTKTISEVMNSTPAVEMAG